MSVCSFRVQHFQSAMSLRKELSSCLNCAVMLTSPVTKADTSRGEGTVGPDGGGGNSAEIFGFTCTAQWHIYVAQVVFALKAYLLTPWNRVLLEKLTGLQLVKKFPAFYGTRMFLTVLTSARHLSLSSASPIQSSHPHPTS
jgi:hypothetical protein